MEKKIVPAIIAKDQEELDAMIRKVEDSCDVLHLDIMDGKFVPNESINFDFHVQKNGCCIEAHMMVENPGEWIRKHYDKVDRFQVHLEACDDPGYIIRLAREKKKGICFAINPETLVEKLMPYIKDIDQALILTVKPGFYGSSFLPEELKKVEGLRRLSPYLDIEVDGGITDKTIGLVENSGANMFVSGSFIMKAKDQKTAINALKKGLRNLN